MKLKHVLLSLVVLLLIAVSVVAAKNVWQQTGTQPMPSKQTNQTQQINTYADCIAAGGEQVPTLAPPSECEINGKMYSDTGPGGNTIEGATDLASCLDRVNKSDANEVVLEAGRKACHKQFDN